ncbi:Por secretion system C-terminal sorting domain-containing protein [Hyunsoonleella jejuensis]|uniref:Por secretion system C-terminal sorting domain-containing protein n=2 Tax=Hyunsoonleella jejuensis TaxID=419940 RepID=A0A1H9AR86_9FLAO|nr:Por secretion system C-terminal sorting domain-containing protein [Hyunsoonleella jejuensis]
MKKITSILLLLLAFSFGYGQTTLSVGDIAITGVNTQNPDQFSFVLLTDVTAGTTINFTDFGWLSSGSFNTSFNEGVVTWTASLATSCGTEIIITDIGGNNYSSLNFSGSAIGSAAETDAGFALSGGGDQVIAYQGTLAAPTLLYAVHVANNNGWTDATDTSNSAVPGGLTDSVNAMTFNRDNCIYNRSVLANQALIINAVADATNWSGANGGGPNRQTLGGAAPYTCVAPGTCSSTVTWNGTWVGGTPDLSTEVIINDNYDTTTDGSFSACTLTVNGGFNLNINDGDYVEVENDVTVDGQLFVQSQGNFIQNNDTATFTDNSTNGVLMNKTKTVANKFVYTYWSSPINNGLIENVFSTVPVDKRFEFIAANFVDLEEEIGNTGTFLPNAGVDDIDDNGDDWNFASGALVPGVGYAMRTNEFGPAFPRPETFSFIGEFNNGVITQPLVNNSGGAYNDWNLIGNPYPCAINADRFFAVNTGVVDAIYLWDQFTAPSETASGNEGYNFSGADYAMINGSGSVSNGASGTIPNRFVPSGQGFFVEALSASNVTFNNSMRLITNDNSQFFKGKSSKSNSSENENKLWINLSSDNGAANQILVSYLDGATNNNDGSFYDLKRPVSTGNKALLYSFIENDNGKFAIQGKASNSLDTDEVVKLGFKTSIDVATIYTLSIAQLQGDFLSNNSIYLKDNLTNTVHNLSDSDYSFTSDAGEFNERFEIVFSAAALSNDAFVLDANTIKIVQLDNETIQFTTEVSNFTSISIFDLLGRNLYDLKSETNTETYNLSSLKNSVYIASMELANGATVSKKFVKK